MSSTQTLRPAHSPLGASGAERWLRCPGSVELIKNLKLPESDAPDYRKDGTAAHALGAHCLACEGTDAWEKIGEKFGDLGQEVEVTDDMAKAVQIYLDTVRPIIARADEAQTKVMIEYPISSPAHKDFYGTVDLAVIVPGEGHRATDLDLTDYKHGEGIQVDVEHNPQLMYYAYGVLQEYEEVDKVTLRIVQPRGFHPDGPVRGWTTNAQSIREWAENVLVPAMIRTELEHDLDAGPWCRFCPAKLVCPLLTGLFRAACLANPKDAVNVTDESLGRSYTYTQAVKLYLKALEDEAFRRLNGGTEIAGIKLVHKKGNRVWKPEALPLFKSKFEDKAFTQPEMLSPAEMEKISPEAKKLVREYAYTPETGLTVALADDKRVGVKVQSTAEKFAAAAPIVVAQPAEDDLFTAAPANTDGLDIPGFLKREPKLTTEAKPG